jgi:protein subunit release factor B
MREERPPPSLRWTPEGTLTRWAPSIAGAEPLYNPDTRCPSVQRSPSIATHVSFHSGVQERLDALGVLASDVEERFVRGSGPGGQKINKTSSTVCLKHRPTGVEVRCQRERSQAANRETAWADLCDKLELRLRAAEHARLQALARQKRKQRPRSARQKAISVAGKRHRAEIKEGRRRAAT